MESLAKLVGAVVILAVVIVACSFLMALPTWLLWNWLVPEIFGLKTITLLQALGLNVLSGILFRLRTSSGSN